MRFSKCMLVALTTVGAMFVFAGSALADGSQPTITNESWSYSSVTFSDKSVAIVDGSANAIEQVRFTMPNGLPKSQRHGTCLVAANDNKPARGKHCGHIKIGTAYTNSGTLRSTGRFGMFTDYVRAGDTFYLVNGQWRKGKCGNKVWFKSRPKGRVLPYARVRVVRYFTWTARVSVLARQSGSVDAMAICSATGVSASASAHAEGFAEAGGKVSFTFTARTRVQAISGARNLAISEIDRVALKGDVKAAVLIKLAVAAAVSCSSVTPPVTPPVVSPPTASVDIVQEINASDYSVTPAITHTVPTCGHVVAPIGDVLNITFKVGYGNYGLPGNLTLLYESVTATGSSQPFCPTYTSPTEWGIQDQVTMTVLDVTTNQHAVATSNWFDIVEPTLNP